MLEIRRFSQETYSCSVPPNSQDRDPRGRRGARSLHRAAHECESPTNFLRSLQRLAVANGAVAADTGSPDCLPLLLHEIHRNCAIETSRATHLPIPTPSTSSKLDRDPAPLTAASTAASSACDGVCVTVFLAPAFCEECEKHANRHRHPGRSVLLRAAREYRDASSFTAVNL